MFSSWFPNVPVLKANWCPFTYNWVSLRQTQLLCVESGKALSGDAPYIVLMDEKVNWGVCLLILYIYVENSFLSLIVLPGCCLGGNPQLALEQARLVWAIVQPGVRGFLSATNHVPGWFSRCYPFLPADSSMFLILPLLPVAYSHQFKMRPELICFGWKTHQAVWKLLCAFKGSWASHSQCYQVKLSN